MKVKGKALGAVMAISLCAGQAMAADGPDCLTGEEVKALALVLLPEGLQAVSDKCADALPLTALLARADAPMFERYRVDAAPHMAQAQKTFARMSGLDEDAETNAVGLDLMKAMIVPELSKEIKLKDCGAINHMIELFEPMPPENMAGAIATILQIIARDEAAKSGRKKKKSDNDFNICPYRDAR